MPEHVIVNTSPLFYLHRLGLLELLEKLYGTIIVPQGVVYELEQGKLQGEDVPDIKDYPWIQAQKVEVPKYLKLITDLGLGEAEVLALSIEKPGSLIILDERLARRIVELRGLRFTGPAGIILKSKMQGHIESVSEVNEKLLRLGFRLSDKLKEDILKLAGELSK
ncbi:DUF3368 domain-containing protein [candidate division KSB1 bacterium]|nr:DUF3368 domain-containing protein [candidate division KSB1 bacterium]